MMPRFLTLILILILALGSCTIEKRTFNRGYHVSWNKKVDFRRGGLGGLSTTKDEIKTTEEVAENEEAVAVVETETEPVVVPSPETDLNPPRRKSVEFVEYSQDQILAESPTAEPDTVYFYPKFERFGIASFTSSLLAYGSTIAAIAFYEEIFIIAGLVLIVAGFIFGIISLIRYNRDKILYRTNVFGIIGFVLAAIPVFGYLLAFFGLW